MTMWTHYSSHRGACSAAGCCPTNTQELFCLPGHKTVWLFTGWPGRIMIKPILISAYQNCLHMSTFLYLFSYMLTSYCMLLLMEFLFVVDTNLPSGIHVAAEHFEFPSGLIKHLSIYLVLVPCKTNFLSTVALCRLRMGDWIKAKFWSDKLVSLARQL